MKLDDAEQTPVEEYADVSWWDIVREFTVFGYTAFGGPAAHIGFFQRRLVDKLKWMSTAVFVELFALGQCLPGPTSTQVSFALGMVKKGWPGGLLSGALFQYPGAVVMTIVGVGAAKWLEHPAAWLNGLVAGVSAVGVALIATAAKNLCMKLCADKVTATIACLAATATIYWPKAWMFPSAIAVGGIVTIITKWKEDLTLKGRDPSLGRLGINMYFGAALILGWLAILLTVILVVNIHRDSVPLPLEWFEVFYRTGSIIYGGGQVVLPLLVNDLVQYNCTGSAVPPNCPEASDTWVTQAQFYAGLGAVQALPGPLFNFAAYLGAILAQNSGYFFLWGTLLAWFGLFGPGVTLMFGVMPFWKKFRKLSFYRRALPGLNAAGVGLIVASVFTMGLNIYNISPFQTSSLCIGILAFGAVESLGIYEPIVVFAGGALGVIAWAADMH